MGFRTARDDFRETGAMDVEGRVCPILIDEDGSAMPCSKDCAWRVADGRRDVCAVACLGAQLRRLAGVMVNAYGR